MGKKFARSRSRFALAIAAVFLVAVFAPAYARDDAVELGPGIEAPWLVENSAPHYPESAAREGIGGRVVARIRIDTAGRVSAIEIVSSPDDRLTKAARRAIDARRYTPATRDGRRVSIWITTQVDFYPPESEKELEARCANAPEGPADPVDLTWEDVLPRLIQSVEPKQPTQANGKRVWGKVTLDCVIDTCGRVRDCRALETPGPECTEAAIAAVTQWRYVPGVRAGNPIAVRYTIHITWSGG